MFVWLEKYRRKRMEKIMANIYRMNSMARMCMLKGEKEYCDGYVRGVVGDMLYRMVGGKRQKRYGVEKILGQK